MCYVVLGLPAQWWILCRVWKSSFLSIRINVHLCQALVLSVLLYGAETWTLLADMKTLEAFHMRCQWQILDIPWWGHVSNTEVLQRSGLSTIIIIIIIIKSLIHSAVTFYVIDAYLCLAMLHNWTRTTSVCVWRQEANGQLEKTTGPPPHRLSQQCPGSGACQDYLTLHVTSLMCAIDATYIKVGWRRPVGRILTVFSRTHFHFWDIMVFFCLCHFLVLTYRYLIYSIDESFDYFDFYYVLCCCTNNQTIRMLLLGYT